MDKLKLILEAVALGVFSIWAAWTEFRLRSAQAQNEVMANEIQETKNKDANAALSDSDARAKLAANLSSGSS